MCWENSRPGSCGTRSNSAATSSGHAASEDKSLSEGIQRARSLRNVGKASLHRERREHRSASAAGMVDGDVTTDEPRHEGGHDLHQHKRRTEQRDSTVRHLRPSAQLAVARAVSELREGAGCGGDHAQHGDEWRDDAVLLGSDVRAVEVGGNPRHEVRRADEAGERWRHNTALRDLRGEHHQADAHAQWQWGVGVGGQLRHGNGGEHTHTHEHKGPRAAATQHVRRA